MPRARRLAVSAVAAAALGVWCANSRHGGHPHDATSESPQPGAKRSPSRLQRGAGRGAPVARAAATPRPGRALSWFRAPSNGADTALVARALIASHRAELGLDAMPGELRVRREFDSLSGHHLRMEQTLAGVPVFGSEVSAHVTKDGRPLLVQADIYPLDGATTTPVASADHASAAAVAWVSDADQPAAVETKPAQLVILPEGRRGRLVWRVDVRTNGDSARVFVDAADGEVVRSDSLRAGADGTGAVFDPNPVYRLRNGSLRDNQDRDSAALTGARVVVTLPRLDGTGYLRGQWADLTATSDPAFSAALDWSSVTRSDRAFEQVMGYYHADRAQQRLQDLGIANVNAAPQKLDAHALAEDQSYFDAFGDVIRLGDGGVDDAEDADIIRHEYGHGIQFSQVADFGLSNEGAAMGEGFGDFHAASFHSGDPAFDPLVGSWDATSYSKSNPPFLRRVDGSKRYPRDVKGEPHADGEIWSRFLWDLRTLLGNDDALRVVVESHFLLTPSSGFLQGTNAVLLANESVRDGADDVKIRDLLDARGLSYSVPFAHPPADDAFEPNDDVDHPALLTPGAYPGLVSVNEDWYELFVPPNRRFHVMANFDPDAANLDLALYAKLGATPQTNELVRVSQGIGGQETLDASAGPEGATYYLRVYDGDPGTHAAAYDLAVSDADLLPLVPGRATFASLTPLAIGVYRIEVPASKVGADLSVASRRRRVRGAAAQVRIVAPSGEVVVDFGAGARRGSRAKVPLDQVGRWIVEVRSRDATAGAVRLRADFR